MKVITKKILNNFLIGILAVVPFVIVLQIVIFIKNLLMNVFGLVYDYSNSYFTTVSVFVLSFFILVFLGHQIVLKGRPLVLTLIEYVIEKIPFLNTIYRVIKKVIDMFIKKDQTIAKEVVYVEYPKDGIWVPAYVTNRYENKVVLFIPTSPIPTSGFTVIVDKTKIVESEMDIEDATSFIASVGVDYEKAAEMKQLP